MRTAIAMILVLIPIALGCDRPPVVHAGETAASAASLINGPADFAGSVIVRGPVTFDGPAWVYGKVVARSMTVHGPLTQNLSQETAGADRKVFDKGLTITGPVKIHGSLIVDGALTVHGPLWCEAAKESDEPLKLFQFAASPRSDSSGSEQEALEVPQATASPKPDEDPGPLGFHRLQRALGLPLH